VQDIRKKQLLLVGITIAALAPFLNKAFHIDDPLFLWMAQQITRHPFDPYGFSVVWGESSLRPMWQNMLNPPLCSYFIALVASIAGWSEIVLHSAFLVVAITAVLGTFALARRLCANPGAAALLTLFTPVFLVSATNVMCDVMLVAFWVWSIECWLAGLEHREWRLLALASVLVSAATLTKYFGCSLVPLLVLYTVLRKPRSWLPLLFLSIPIFVILLYEVLSRIAYSHGMVGNASSLLLPFSGKGGPFLSQLVSSLGFTGGCLFGAVAFAGVRRWRSWLIAFAVLAISSVSFHAFGLVDRAMPANVAAVSIAGALFSAIGIWILTLAALDLLKRRDADSTLLFTWVIGTFLFAAFLNWVIAARTILPMAPAVAILLLRQFDRAEPSRRWMWSAVSCTAVVSLLIGAADFRLANSGRKAANHFQRHFGAEPDAVWFYGHWGFQYYMEQWGAKPLTTVAIPSPNNVMIVAEGYPDDPSVTDRKVIDAKRVSFSTSKFVATLSHGAGAGFYSHGVGSLPWVIDRVPPETYYVARLE
jgi:4-amino-4-deoxy-L-arabinose transferase-like glycosyltransferase